jgi:ribA/ribD-fused uncharacterized protein
MCKAMVEESIAHFNNDLGNYEEYYFCEFCDNDLEFLDKESVVHDEDCPVNIAIKILDRMKHEGEATCHICNGPCRLELDVNENMNFYVCDECHWYSWEWRYPKVKSDFPHPPTVIDDFSGKYEFLSNFYREQDGLTLEHRYQAAKATNKEDYLKVFQAPTPGKSKRLGRKIQCREDWQEIKVEVMSSLVRYKFLSDPKLMKALRDTGDARIVKGNHWHDNFWGDCSCDECENIKGENHLGLILMKIRDYGEEHQ